MTDPDALALRLSLVEAAIEYDQQRREHEADDNPEDAAFAAAQRDQAIVGFKSLQEVAD